MPPAPPGQGGAGSHAGRWPSHYLSEAEGICCSNKPLAVSRNVSHGHYSVGKRCPTARGFIALQFALESVMFIQSYAFKNKGFGFYIGELCVHMLINAPTPSCSLLKFSRVLSRAQLRPLHKAPQTGSEAPRASAVRPPAPLRGCGFHRDSLGQPLSSSPGQSRSSRLSSPPGEALMHSRSLFITLQRNVLHLNL